MNTQSNAALVGFVVAMSVLVAVGVLEVASHLRDVLLMGVL